MLPRKHRLPLRTELARVQKEGRLFQGRLFSLLVCSTSEVSGLLRFGFIISTKIHKKAVKRNRAKRLLNEAIGQLLPKIKPGFDVIVLAKKKIIDASLAELKEELERLLIIAEMMAR